MTFVRICPGDDKYHFFACFFLLRHLIEYVRTVEDEEQFLQETSVSWCKKGKIVCLEFLEENGKPTFSVAGTLKRLASEQRVPVTIDVGTKQLAESDATCLLSALLAEEKLAEEWKRTDDLQKQLEFQDTHQMLPADLLPFFISSTVESKLDTVVHSLDGAAEENAAYASFLDAAPGRPLRHFFSVDVSMRRSVRYAQNKFALLVQYLFTVQSSERRYIHVSVKGNGLSFTRGSLQCSLFNGTEQPVTRTKSSGAEVGASFAFSPSSPVFTAFAKYSVSRGTSVSTQRVSFMQDLDRMDEQSIRITMESLPKGRFTLPVWILLESTCVSLQPSVSVTVSHDQVEAKRSTDRAKTLDLQLPKIQSAIVMYCFIGRPKSGKSELLAEWLRCLGGDVKREEVDPHNQTEGTGFMLGNKHVGAGLVDLYDVTDCSLIQEQVILPLKRLRPQEEFSVKLLDTKGIFLRDEKTEQKEIQSDLDTLLSLATSMNLYESNGAHVYQGIALLESAKRFYIRRRPRYYWWKGDSVVHSITSLPQTRADIDANMVKETCDCWYDIHRRTGIKPLVILTMVDRLVFPGIPHGDMYDESGNPHIWHVYSNLKDELSGQPNPDVPNWTPDPANPRIDYNCIKGVAKSCKFNDGKYIADIELQWWENDWLYKYPLPEKCFNTDHKGEGKGCHTYDNGADTDNTLKVLISSLHKIVVEQSKKEIPKI